MYGKGTAKACRKHVQKLNMIQGERERSGGGEGGGGVNHPPCDYASTFTTQNARTEEKVGWLDNFAALGDYAAVHFCFQLGHPVVLAGNRKSKWTTFTEPHKDEVCTMNGIVLQLCVTPCIINSG